MIGPPALLTCPVIRLQDDDPAAIRSISETIEEERLRAVDLPLANLIMTNGELSEFAIAANQIAEYF
ncbi:hypothetical protein FHT32_006741 [Variovorax sp. SG517]|uniref:hypothetical protein n=1 Tax=Variovorax sp. SG517 TaxID=2587117 RepID=UPI00159E793B|nr:hypothetical protein [Variovorax sp. SG517]NVM93048.1 hypothetical protein [Variovorax sp. SG517]